MRFHAHAASTHVLKGWGVNVLIPFVEIILAIALFVMAMFILMVLSVIIGFLPALVAAVVFWFLTGSLFYAAVAFLVVAFLWVLIKRK